MSQRAFNPQTVPTMEFSQNEKREVILKGFMTAGFFSIVYLLLIYIFRQTLLSEGGSESFQVFKEWFTNSPGYIRITEDTITFIYGLAMIIGVTLSCRNRIQRITLNHIQAFIHYMALGNYDLRIDVDQAGGYQDLAKNVNTLIDSIQHAMEEQEKAEAAKDEMIHNIGHDLRTPLTSMIGFLGLLESKAYRNQDELDQYINVAYSKTKSMQSLVNDLFDYASSLHGNVTLNYQPIPLSPYLEQISADFMMEAQNKNIEIQTQVRPEELMLEIDPERMARAISNLVANAIKYGKGASYIQLKAYEVKASLYKSMSHLPENSCHKPKQVGDWVFIEVRNNGEKLSDHDLKKIFERSYRADSSRNSKEPGSGLGLAIVKNLLELHHGNVYALVENEDLVFRLEVPKEQLGKD